MDEDLLLIEAHFCYNGKIKPYPQLLCSLCKEGKNVLVTKVEMDEYNGEESRIRNNRV